jgi:tetratricopeptide (TPR) repeat protein
MIGRLRDHGLLGFLREFAAGNTGLCVTTSRLPLMDLSDFVGSAVTERKLKPLTPQQGERMLRGLQVKGTRNERIKAAQAFRGHCLGLTLLAAYLTHRYGGDPRRYREVRPLSADRKEQHHARRILNADGKWFQGRLEQSILYAMSFFERAVDLSTIANLIETLRDWLPVRAFDFEELKDAVVGLSDLGLLYNLASQGTIWLVDTHPLIREHFSEDLRRSARNAWRAGHAQLFQDLSRRVPQQPVSRDELEILHTAVRHGCFADCRPEALEVLAKRIFQLDELGEQYLSLHKFGMYAEGLSALTGFFRERWKSVYQDLSSSQQAQILVVAGYCLRAVGALDDAAIATAEAQNLFEPINVNEAADAAGNLTQMLVASGKLREAVEAGLRAVEIGAACPDPKRRKERYNLASLADAYHQAGMLRESEQCFARSEELQKSVFPDLPFLISYRGFLYCDLLLGFGRLTEVRKRAKSSLRHPKSSAHPGIQGLDLLSIGRSYLAERPPHLKSARTSLQKAEELVRQGVNWMNCQECCWRLLN